MRRVILLPLCLWLAACPSVDPDIQETGPINVGPEGGLFIRDGVAVEVPSDAVGSLTQIVVTRVLEGIPEVKGRVRISDGWRLSPSALTFKKPIKVTVVYRDDLLPRGDPDPAEYDLRRNDIDLARQLSNPSTNVELKAVTSETDRLGLFWATAPAPPGPATIEISPEQAVVLPGGTQSFSALVKDANGGLLNDPVTWTIYTARMASIDEAGNATAIAPGIATVVARAGEIEAQAKFLIVGTPTGATTFAHENPFPTGEDLRAGVMVEGQPLIAGGNGTALARRADGAWARLFSTPGVTFRAIARVGETLVGAGSMTTTGVLFESGPAGLSTASIRDFSPRTIWFDGTHGIAAGFGNDLFVRRDGAWVEDDSPTFETVLAVSGDGMGGYTALGDLGSIYRYDPATTAWDPVNGTRLPVLLSGAVLVDGPELEAWAAGGSELLHFKDGAWTSTPLPTSPPISEITALGYARGRVFLATRSQAVGYLRSYDPAVAASGGNGWVSSQTVRAPQMIRSIFGDAANAFAVGDFGAIYEFNGNTFEERSRGFYDDVSAVSVGSDIVVAAKRLCLNTSCNVTDGEVIFRDGSGVWTRLGSTQPFPSEVLALLAVSSTEVYAGGAGFLYRWSGSNWTTVSVQGLANIEDLARCGDSLVAVGHELVDPFAGTSEGRWWSGGDSLTRQPNLAIPGNPATMQPAQFPQLYSVSCTGADNLQIVGDGVLFDNRSLSRALDDPKTEPDESAFRLGPWREVWTPGANEAYAFGGTYYGEMWNGYALDPMQFPSVSLDEVTGLWGSSVDNLYAVGFASAPLAFGVAMRFTGVNWEWIDLGTMRRPLGGDGRSPTHAYVVTEMGGILRAVPPSP